MDDIIVSLSSAQTCICPLRHRRAGGRGVGLGLVPLKSFCCAFSLLNQPRDNCHGETGRDEGGERLGGEG